MQQSLRQAVKHRGRFVRKLEVESSRFCRWLHMPRVALFADAVAMAELLPSGTSLTTDCMSGTLDSVGPSNQGLVTCTCQATTLLDA